MTGHVGLETKSPILSASQPVRRQPDVFFATWLADVQPFSLHVCIAGTLHVPGVDLQCLVRAA